MKVEELQPAAITVWIGPFNPGVEANMPELVSVQRALPAEGSHVELDSSVTFGHVKKLSDITTTNGAALVASYGLRPGVRITAHEIPQDVTTNAPDAKSHLTFGEGVTNIICFDRHLLPMAFPQVGVSDDGANLYLFGDPAIVVYFGAESDGTWIVRIDQLNLAVYQDPLSFLLIEQKIHLGTLSAFEISQISPALAIRIRRQITARSAQPLRTTEGVAERSRIVLS